MPYDLIDEIMEKQKSDMDIAVFDLKDQHFLRLIAEISGRLEPQWFAKI